MTGPTNPVMGRAAAGEKTVSFRFPRSADTTADCRIAVRAEESLTGYLEYKRYNTDDPWTRVEMAREGERLAALLPRQPAAGKVAYRVVVADGRREFPISGEEPIVLRFKDPVPGVVQVPHILIMFLAMLFSTRAGLAALDRSHDPRRLAVAACVLLFVGGFLLGPLMQHFAFGKFWTGFPFGTDMTDNKTLVAMIFWVAAVVAGRKGKPARGWILAASLILLLVYSIPHSLFGSELDYAKVK
jgi:hypothetical protein